MNHAVRLDRSCKRRLGERTAARAVQGNRNAVVTPRTHFWASVQECSPRSRSKIEDVSLPVTLPLIDHLALRVRDLRRSRTFYEQALEPFGVKVVESSQGPGFAIEGGGDFWIGEGEPPAAPVHVAFAAADRATVDKFHRAAVEAGGRDNGAPGLRPQYHAGYYAAFVIDPDGNNVEAVFHGNR
jgi:catechol 2,3-dioxygenase-like lactoylglutathione lyase family enzyme